MLRALTRKQRFALEAVHDRVVREGIKRVLYVEFIVFSAHYKNARDRLCAEDITTQVKALRRRRLIRYEKVAFNPERRIVVCTEAGIDELKKEPA